MNGWFGTSWGAPVCQTTPQVAVPVGAACVWCKEPIGADDSGIVVPLMDNVGNVFVVSTANYHVECWGRQIVGSVAHQLGLCGCAGDNLLDGDPPELSTRDAARAAWAQARELWQTRKDEDHGDHD